MPLQPPKTCGEWKPTKVCKIQKRSQAGNQAHGGETLASTVYRPKGVHGNQGFTSFDWGRTHLGGNLPRHRHALNAVCDPHKTVATGDRGNLDGGQ